MLGSLLGLYSLAGPLSDKVIEIHAGSTYLDAIRLYLERLGAQVVDPLHGLSMGQRLAWYRSIDQELAEKPNHVGQFVEVLRDSTSAVSPEAFADRGKATVDRPGLYSWWVDQAGAEDLSRGLGSPVQCGLIYGGLAGATRWPSGKRSNNTLWSRVMTMHLGGNHEFSTFRRTLGAILAADMGAARIDEMGLTQWMREHLRIVAIPFEDPDVLGRLERDVLERLDPPLNLQSMRPTPLRHCLKELRRAILNPTRLHPPRKKADVQPFGLLIARPCRNTGRLPAIDPACGRYHALMLGRPLQSGAISSRTPRSRRSTRPTIPPRARPALSPLHRVHARTRLDSPSIPTSDHGST